MSTLVLSCGRSGTNLVLEILRKSKQLNATDFIEDKNIFVAQKTVDEQYLSKCDTHYCRNFSDIDAVMNKNPHLRIVWTIRDIKDMILSKINKGQAGSDGNATIADDATPNGCIEDITHMFSVYQYIVKNYGDRIFLIKMEDVILNFEESIKNLCMFLNIEYNDDMKNFSLRNNYKAQRYKGLDKSQVGLWENRYEIYDGFFSKKDYQIEYIAEQLNNITNFFGYEIFDNR